MIFKPFDTDKIKTARSEKERRGFENEKQTAYLIDFELRDSKNYAVLHDLRFEYNGRSAQIDHLIIGQNFIFVVESKFFGGNLEIGKDNWVVDYGSKKYSIPSPVKQNERHIKVLQEIIDQEDIFQKNMIIPSIVNIVLISNKTIIKGDRPKEVVYADSFRDKMKSSIVSWILRNPLALFSIKSNFPLQDFPKICGKMLRFHKPIERSTSTQGDTDPAIEDKSAQEPLAGKTEEILQQSEPVRELSTTHPDDEVLCAALKKTRRHLAHETGVAMAHHIFNDNTLREFVEKRPRNKTEMLAIGGVGEVKFERYGKQFLEIINPDLVRNIPSPNPLSTIHEDLKIEELKCDQCGSIMVYRKGKPGQTDFYGCSTYPKCRHTVKIKPSEEQ